LIPKPVWAAVLHNIKFQTVSLMSLFLRRTKTLLCYYKVRVPFAIQIVYTKHCMCTLNYFLLINKTMWLSSNNELY